MAMNMIGHNVNEKGRGSSVTIASRDHAFIQKPQFFCEVHKIVLKPSLMETKDCPAKKCPHFLAVKEVFVFG